MHAFHTITRVIDKATEKVKAEDPGLHCDVVNPSTLIRAHSTGCKIRIRPHSGQNHRKWVLTLKEHILGFWIGHWLPRSILATDVSLFTRHMEVNVTWKVPVTFRERLK